jgi:pyruvate formate lyase activating enzyme
VILDVKGPDPARFQWLTGRDIQPLHCFLDHLQLSGCRTWIRQVIVPGWNDKPDDLQELAVFLARWPGLSLEKVELLPYHTYGKVKWGKLNRPYALPDVPPISDSSLADLKRQVDQLVSAERTGCLLSASSCRSAT